MLLTATEPELKYRVILPYSTPLSSLLVIIHAKIKGRKAENLNRHLKHG